MTRHSRPRSRASFFASSAIRARRQIAGRAVDEIARVACVLHDDAARLYGVGRLTRVVGQHDNPLQACDASRAVLRENEYCARRKPLRKARSASAHPVELDEGIDDDVAGRETPVT